MRPPDPLSKLLKSWRHEPSEAPRFQAAVWARIETSRQGNNVTSFYRWALPVAASVALLLGIGSAVRDVRHQHTEQMAAAYVSAVDPLQMTGHHHAP